MARRFPALMLVLLAFAACAAAKTHKKSHKAKTKAAVVQPAPEPAPAPVPPPLTPEQGPSYPPEVSFQGGQLTIVAKNSTMGDVLTAVRKRTGAAVDMPPAPSERVVGRFGPGAPRDVMAQLLNGSHYDYVLVGSPADPGSLQKVVLVARVNGPQGTMPAPNQAAVQANQYAQPAPDVVNEEPQPEENSASGEMPEAQEQPEQEEPQPGQGQANPVKTPEQLLRELQQQQQQMQQQQQQQNGQAPPQ